VFFKRDLSKAPSPELIYRRRAPSDAGGKRKAAAAIIIVAISLIGFSLGGCLGGSGKYIGNKESKIFHKESCSYLPAEDHRVYFSSRDAAISAGYDPCEKCNP